MLRRMLVNALAAAVTILVLALPARAEDSARSEATTSAETAAPAIPRFGLSFSSYRYDFQGRKAAHDDLYSFADAGLNMQLLVATFMVSPEWTLAAASSFLSNYVETKIGNTLYRDRTTGLGDTRLMGIHPLLISGTHAVLLEAGVSLPTGSISKANQSIPGPNYPYNMQLGSGTLDPVAAITYSYAIGPVTLGTRGQAVMRLYDNRNRYRLGNEYQGNLWADYRLSGYFTPSLKFNFRSKGAISGGDPTLGRNPYTEYYYHAQNDWGLQLVAHSAIPLFTKLGVTLNLEAGLPLAQGMSNYDGVYVATRYYALAGLQMAM